MTSFSLVIPLFDVERYLPELLDSLASQRPGDYAADVLFVDDGSPDASAEVVQRWMETTSRPGMTVRLIRQANRGVSAARNVGIDEASGEWITFPDPDDVLDAGYLSAIAGFLGAHREREPHVVASYIKRLDDRRGGRILDNHALRGRFAPGSRVVELDRDPDVFQLNAATAFFRRADILRLGVRFPEGLHASEDALFVARLLLDLDGPRLGLVREAEYLYRKRAGATSAVDGYTRRADTYVSRFDDGYLPLLRAAAERFGAVPGWLQSTVLYEFKWLIGAQAAPAGYASVLDEEGRARVLEIVRRLLDHLEPARILEFAATYLSVEVRFLLLALKGVALPPWQDAYVDRIDAERRLKRLRYLVADDDRSLPPSSAATWRVPDYFGQEVLRELIAWVPLEQVSLHRGGMTIDVTAVEPSGSVEQSRDEARRTAVGGAHARGTAHDTWSRLRRGAVSKAAVVWAISRLPFVGRRYRGAWLLDAATDDGRIGEIATAAAERGHAVFVLGGSAPSELRGVRGIRPGSRAHRVALMRARELVSTDPDVGASVRAASYRGRRSVRLTWVGEALPTGADLVALDASDVDRLVLSDASTPSAAGSTGSTRYTAQEIRHAPSDPTGLVEVLAGR